VYLKRGILRDVAILAGALAVLPAFTTYAQKAPVVGPGPDSTPVSSVSITTGQVSRGVVDDAATFKAGFNNTPLDTVMQEYSQLTGLIPLIAPGVSANITWYNRNSKLTKKEYLQGIVSMLSMNGVALVPYGEKFVKVVKSETARSVAMETQMEQPVDPIIDSDSLISRVVTFQNMEIVEATKVIDALKSQFGKWQPLERINSVLLTDAASNVNRIMEMLNRVDQPIKTQEKFFILPVRFMKPSEVKSKLEELIADLKDKAVSVPTVSKPSMSGPPTIIPGIIRARPTMPSSPGETVSADAEVEKGMIRGKVKMVADDRTGILIFITHPSNMEFFEQAVQALDKDVKSVPDVLVRVYRMEFADADAVAGMLNTLIGATTKKDSTAAVPVTPKATATVLPGLVQESKGAATLAEFVKTRSQTDEEASAAMAGRKSKIGELAAENIKILPDKRTNALIIMASKSDQDTIADLIKEMDMMLSQVLIEAVIINIDLSDSMKTGVQWLQNAMVVYDKKNGGKPIGSFAGVLGGGTDAQGAGGLPTPLDAAGAAAFPGAAGLSYYLTHYGLNVSAVIQMASSDSRTKVVSTPVILTTDNTEATLKIMDQVYVSNGQTLQQVLNQYQPLENFTIKDIGLELKVKPHINTNKVVMMEISQSVSDPGAVGAPQAGAKVSSTRSLTASIAVRDRETIILGGQVHQNTGTTRFKVPLLGDIPLLGRLFNSTSDSGGRTEMMVLITPYVLDTPSAIEAESIRRKRSMTLEGVWKREWTDSKLADLTWEQKLQARKDERDRQRAEKEEAARVAAEKKEREQVQKEEAKRAAEATKKAAAVDPALLDKMTRQQSQWKDSFDQVDQTTSVETGKVEK